MDIDNIIYESENLKDLQTEIKNEKLSKSILLISKDSFYSFSFAKILSSIILNNGTLENNENFQKIKIDSHPDVKIYPKGEKLIVAESEEIVMESFIKPIFSEKKIFIIQNIDNTLDSAQNKLLKILEEPPQNVYFILTCQSENLVLPTIRSRCNKIELSKLKISQIEELYKGEQNVNLISALSDGLVGRAEILKNKTNLREIFETVLSIVVDMKSSKQVLHYSNKLSALKENILFILEIMSLIIEDILMIKTGGEIKLKKYIKEIETAQEDYSYKAVCEINKLLNKALKEIFYNTNQNVVIENLLLNILEVKFVCK